MQHSRPAGHPAFGLRAIQLLIARLAWFAMAWGWALGSPGAQAQQHLHLQYFAEPGQPMSAEEVLDLPESAWQTADGQDINLGYTTRAHWFRAHMRQDDASTSLRLLEIAYPVLDQIDLYLNVRTAVPSTPWQHHWRLGDKLPFDQRPLPHTNFVVPVEVPLGAELEVLARVHTSSAMQFPLVLWRPALFHQHAEQTQLLQGAYVGVMLGLLVYNLILWLAVRERTYLLYVGWVASISACLISLNGLSFQYLWPQATQWNDTVITLSLSLSAAFGAAFAADFVKLGSRPRWRRIAIRIGTIGALLVGAATLVLPYAISIHLAIKTAVAVISLITVIAGLRAWEGYLPARIFILAFGAVLSGGVVLALAKFGLIERSVFTEHAAQIGSAIEVLLISLGLAARLNQERSLRERAQARALQVQRDARSLLETRVHERTRELEQANRQLAQLSLTDGLTAIPNRRFLDDALARELEAAILTQHHLSVALVDVDHFKQFNDTHGHLTGDLCLQTVAAELQRQAQRTGDLVARYGGEEFCIVMPQANAGGALLVAERIRLAIQGLTIETGRGAVGITVSIGVCSWVPNHPDDLGSLLKTADEALYRAKRAGRNRVVLHTGVLVDSSPEPSEQSA